jgi:SAM-dependent methyltransferase
MLYDYPEYYDLAFSFRNYEAEANFLKRCIERYSKIPVRRVLELGCGTAPHAGEMVGYGYDYTGVDTNRNMLDYAIYKWRDLRPHVSFIETDMNTITLDQPADFAFVMLGSLYANGLDELTRHFDHLAAALRPGGLYFLDWCVSFTDPLTRQMHNSMTSEHNGISIESTFHTSLVDSARQLYEEVWTVNVDDHGRRKTIKMVERNRAIFPQEFMLFVKTRPDFEFVGWWYDWDLEKPIVEGQLDVVRPVVVLRRR